MNLEYSSFRENLKINLLKYIDSSNGLTFSNICFFRTYVPMMELLNTYLIHLLYIFTDTKMFTWLLYMHAVVRFVQGIPPWSKMVSQQQSDSTIQRVPQKWIDLVRRWGCSRSLLLLIVCQDQDVTEQALHSLANYHDFLRPAMIILRLCDDLGTSTVFSTLFSTIPLYM